MEIEKDFHIRVDRVTDSSSVSLQSSLFSLKSVEIICGWTFVDKPVDVLVSQHDHKRSVFVGNLSFGEFFCSVLVPESTTAD